MRKKPKHGVDMYAVSRQGMLQADIRHKTSPTDRIFMGAEHFWPDVSNPIAKDVIATVFKMMPADTLYGPAWDEPDRHLIEVHNYQAWINEELGKSGLAKGIAGGEAMLPDPTAHLPWPWKYLARRFGPKNIKQRTTYITRNLEWYVDQSRKLKDPWTIAAEHLPMTFMLTVLMMGALATATPLYKVHWLILLGMTVLTTGIIFTAQHIWGRNTVNHKTNCAELFHYLIREYSDEPEDDSLDDDYYRLKLSRKYEL